MNKIVIISLILLTILLLQAILARMNTVPLIKVAEIEAEHSFGETKYWMLLKENDIKEFEYYNIDRNIVDFSKYNIIVSFTREIRTMRYERTFPVEKNDRVITVVSKDVNPNKLFIYRIDKDQNVYLDLKSFTFDRQIIIEQ
ncbi:MAG TPA: hypothetical protein PLZ08_11370 [Bacillota bacterium]|mgnify:CR=1 FL=1|jgi:hypothetical protein|nr:hypothetical protein [Bacillota bacterium]HOL10050.1 hypothetical protein [Bacillota bacterium]HPO98538.1 hypothetical protein [Bacillota bacterium]